MDTTELPGNDASWYRALLEDDHDVSPAAAPVPVSEKTVATDHTEVAREDDNTDPDAGDDAGVVVTALNPPVEVEPAAPTESTTSDVATEPGEDTGRDEIAESEARLIAAVSLPADTPADSPTADDVDEATIEQPPAEESDEEELSPGQKTSEMVGKLWTARPPEGPIEGWAPDEMDHAISSTRRFRWTTVIAMVAVLILVVVGLVLLPSVTRNRANAHREMMTAALHDLRTELPATQTSLQVATEPESTTTAMNDLTTQLTALSAKASAVDRAGREPLPSSPPLTSSEPIDALVPIKQRLEPLASTAMAIQRRISNLIEYRTLMKGFLVLPELPTTADSPTQADLRVALAAAQAESASILSDLPDDVSLSEHRAMAREINDYFATWQVDYLEALRTQDSGTAEMLIGELSARLDELDDALVTPLAQIRRQTDADLIDLAREIDEVTALAAGQEPAP